MLVAFDDLAISETIVEPPRTLVRAEHAQTDHRQTTRELANVDEKLRAETRSPHLRDQLDRLQVQVIRLRRSAKNPMLRPARRTIW